MNLEMTVSSHFVQALIRVLDQLGWPERAAHDALGQARRREVAQAGHVVSPVNGSARLRSENGQSMRLPMRVFEALFKAAETALDDPLIGLRAGHVFRIANYGQTGSIYAFARDIRDVIHLNAAYQKIAIDIGKIGYEQQGDDHMTCLKPYYTAQESDDYHHVMAMTMAAYGTAYQWLSWGSGQAIRRVDLPIRERAGAAELAEAQFRCPVRFERLAGRLVFNERAVTQPIPTADAEKRAIAVHKLEALLGGERAQMQFVKAIHQAMRACLMTGRISAGALADRLDLSDTALRKQMKSAGMSYQTELDAVRRALLRERHRDGVSFAAIAADLGYNDQAAFNRAMRRWYGVAPGDWAPDMPTLDG